MSDHGVDPSTTAGRGGRGPRTATAVVLVAALAAGCASVYDGFPAEAEIPQCVALDRQAAAIPSRVRVVEAGTADGDPLHLAVEDRGPGDRGRVVVFLHGVFSDRRTWRFMVGPVAEEHDLLLVDLPGCGGSDCPEPGKMGPGGYDPDSMARAVLGALRSALRGRETARITLATHSIGSAIALRMLGSEALRTEFADVVGRIDGAMLIAPVDFSYARRDPVLEQVADVSGTEIAIGNLLGLVREALAASVRDGCEHPERMPREEVDRMWEIFSDGPRRRASQSMLRSAIPFTGDLRPDWPRIEALVRDYDRVRVPVLLVGGSRDDTLPPSLAFKLRQELPEAWLRVLPGAGHCLSTERPGECARLLLDFIRSRGEGWTAYEEVPGAEGPVASATQ